MMTDMDLDEPPPQIQSSIQNQPQALPNSQRPNTDSKPSRGHEIASKTIKSPPFAYICLELISSLSPPTFPTTATGDPTTSTTAPNPPPPTPQVRHSQQVLDAVTTRTYLTSALTQFLGLTGSAISIDILKIAGQTAWIRVPRQDLSAVVAATGGWVGRGETSEERVGWKVRGSGNWLSGVVAKLEEERIWKD